jgi:drug/metabolite transporter (DMT)-like permease
MLLLASLSWGVSAALSKVALEQLAPLDLLAIEVATGALSLCAVAIARGACPRRPHPAVVLLGVLEPGLSFLLYDVGLAHTTATHGALLLSTETVFTVALAIVLLGERLDARLSIALAAIALLNERLGLGQLVGGGFIVTAATLAVLGAKPDPTSANTG